jgi:hypothetical protein
MVIAQRARAIPLSDVRLTDGALKHAQELNGAYLLSLEPDRMMAFLRKSAGLEPKAEGHGRNEYFGPPDKLDDTIEGRTGETCNVYNMIKMARMLFATQPDIRHADFHERALFNHILGSKDPEDGATCCMVPVGPRHPMILIVTYNRDERQRRTFEILVDGAKVGEQAIERRSPEKKTGFFDVEYRIPAALLQDRQKVTVRFQGTGGNEVVAIYGIRMIRSS